MKKHAKTNLYLHLLAGLVAHTALTFICALLVFQNVVLSLCLGYAITIICLLSYMYISITYTLPLCVAEYFRQERKTILNFECIGFDETKHISVASFIVTTEADNFHVETDALQVLSCIAVV